MTTDHDPIEPDFSTIAAQVDADLEASHGEQSDEALAAFTRRALHDGVRATLGLLARGALVVPMLAGAVLAPSPWARAGAVLIAAGAAWATGRRWRRARARMADTVEQAMVWQSDHEQAQDHARVKAAQEPHDKAKAIALDRLAQELTWDVGLAPVYVRPDDLPIVAAAIVDHGQREAVALRDAMNGSDEQNEQDEQADDVPAVRAWTQRWAGLEPVHQPRPVALVKRHTDAEGRRLERELCQSINKHWTGAFHRLLDEGANPNGHNGSGKPLRIAVLRGRLEYVSWLLTLGADVTTLCHGRTILSALMCQVADYIDEGDGEGDDFVWPEKLELLARWGADPHQMNRWYDEDDDSEGPNAWPFITRWPVLYEAFMKGRQVWLQSDADAMRLLRDGRESVGLAEVADTTRAMLDAARGAGRA
ncbi:hypothetical protein [Burkholderia plantarii]|uniref:hypothetical protein n=1 Tax=Burkholderia plantarii TaxID=41899 RepID=UPI0018DCA938|nr:hypothetical protein [Burkholderia plantarii]MBI0326941.1 hypothetical protein [Burkholderia plantarii]